MDMSNPPDEGRGAPGTGGSDHPAAPDEHDDAVEPTAAAAPAALLDHDPSATEGAVDAAADGGDSPPEALAESDDGPGDPIEPAPVVPLVPIDDPANPGHGVANLVSWVIVAITCIAVAWSLHPEWIFNTNTPTGGDMGAHVWGPAYLRDHLLPNFQLTGWTPDWYAGFPAYVFYMVVPSLLIVILNVGPPVWLSPFLLAALGFAAWSVDRRVRSRVWRVVLWSLIGLAAVLSVPIPYE